jgi:protein Mpv17
MEQLIGKSVDPMHDSMDKVVDELVDKLFDRKLGMPAFHLRDLDNTTLMKPSHPAFSPQASLRPLTPLGTSLGMRASSHRDSTSPSAGYRPHFHMEAMPSRSPWSGYQSPIHSLTSRQSFGINYQPHLGRKATPGQSVQTSAYHMHDVATTLAVTPDEVKASLTMIRDLPLQWLNWYDNKAIEFPLMTKAATSGVCYSIGDLCAQGIAGVNTSTVDLARSARSGAAGFIGYGPPAHYWLNFLDQYMSFGGAWWAVVPKIALTQGPMSVVYNTLYSLLIGAFAFRDPRQVLKDVRDAAVPGFISALKFWPAIHLVTFSVIPIELQVLWVDAAEIVWICILSQVNNEGLRKGKETPDKETPEVIVLSASDQKA